MEIASRAFKKNEEEDIDESEWRQAASKNPVFDFLEDPAENIYSINDGKITGDLILTALKN